MRYSSRWGKMKLLKGFFFSNTVVLWKKGHIIHRLVSCGDRDHKKLQWPFTLVIAPGQKGAQVWVEKTLLTSIITIITHVFGYRKSPTSFPDLMD